MPALTITTAAGPVDLEVEASTYRKGSTRDRGPYREVLYQCPWADSDAVIDALMGTATTNPHAYPGNANLYCLATDAEPKGAARPDAKLYASELCSIRAAYGPIPYDPAGAEFAAMFPGMSGFANTSVQRRTVIEVEQLPEASLAYSSGGLSGRALDDRFKLEYPVTEVVVTRHRLPVMPTGPVDELVSNVNGSAFMGWAMGQVKFQGTTSAEERTNSGSKLYTLEYSFLRKPFDWNAVWSPKKGEGWVVVSDGSGNYPHAYSNLTLALG
jgi:hypothetical protein